MNTFAKTFAIAVLGFVLQASGAAATTFGFVERQSGNDCSGSFGQGFENCKYDGSPIIAKIDFSDDGTTTTTLNTHATKGFPDLLASMFSATKSGNSVTFSFDTSAYGAGIGVLLRYVVVKNGPGFDLFKADVPGFTFNNITLTASTSNGVSHISFYDTLAKVPLPAAGWLMIAGLGGLAALRRRKQAA